MNTTVKCGVKVCWCICAVVWPLYQLSIAQGQRVVRHSNYAAIVTRQLNKWSWIQNRSLLNSHQAPVSSCQSVCPYWLSLCYVIIVCTSHHTTSNAFQYCMVEPSTQVTLTLHLHHGQAGHFSSSQTHCSYCLQSNLSNIHHGCTMTNVWVAPSLIKPFALSVCNWQFLRIYLIHVKIRSYIGLAARVCALYTVLTILYTIIISNKFKILHETYTPDLE